MLGLGLGLNKSNLILTSGVDPRIQAVINANGTLLITGDLANGTSSGNNTDPTSTWSDLINSNDATLNNFAWTTSSGWDGVTVPSGTEQMLKADGVDDYGVIANNANLDPTGTEDFAIYTVAYITNTGTNKWLYCKNLNTFQDTVQYGLRYTNAGNGWLRVGGTSTTFSAGTILLNDLNEFKVKKIGSTLTLDINGTEVINIAFTTSLISQPNFLMNCRSSSTDASTRTEFGDDARGVFAFFYNGATGLNETDVDNACALLRAPYF